MMSSRTKDFKKLDKDGNNLLSFEEWAAATGERFAKADGNARQAVDAQRICRYSAKAGGETGLSLLSCLLAIASRPKSARARLV